MQKNQPAPSEIRLAELIAALSLAIELGMGQPMESALCSSVLPTRLGEALGLGESELREVYYLLLLRHAMAQDAMLLHRIGSEEAALAVVKERKGGAYDPRIVERFCQHAHQLLAGLEEEPS